MAQILLSDSVDSRKQSLVHPSAIAQALRQLETFYPLGPFEMKLLEDKKIMERDPIIAPDGNRVLCFFLFLFLINIEYC